MVHEQLSRFYSGFRRDAHPMAVVGVVGALSAFYHDSLNINDPRHREISAFRLIAKLPTITAMCYKYNIGQPFMYPKNSLSYVENFLCMMFGNPCEEYKPNPVLTRAIDRILILHADHEQNASTSTVRTAGSSGANPFACISAGIASLWGPAHGGANEAVLKMLEEIGDESHIGEYIKRVKDKGDHTVLYGFGHRVYKNYDPRAKLIQKTCHEVLDELDLRDDKLFKLAMALEKDRARGRVFRQPQALSQRRFLLRHRLQGARHPGRHVHRDVRGGAHRRLDRAVERDDRRPRPEDRAPAPALYRPGQTRIRADGQAKIDVGIRLHCVQGNARQFVSVRRQCAVHRGAVRPLSRGSECGRAALAHLFRRAAAAR